MPLSFRRLILTALAVIPCFGVPCLAQRGSGDDPGSQPALKPQKDSATGALTLADEPYRLDSVGLSVRIPLGSQVKSNRIADRQTAQIVPEGSTWLINIQTPTATADNGTIEQALDKTIDLLRGTYGIVDPSQKEVLETQAKIIEQIKDLELPGGPAARLYVSTPRGNQSRLIKGYTIFKPQAKQFVVFEFICHEQDFAKLRGTYETVVGTAMFTGSDATSMARASAIKAGTAFVNSLTEQDYIAAMGEKELWYRMFKPGKTGAKGDDEEIGYKGLRCWRGKRGEINPNKPRNLWKSADEQDGWLASIRSRVLWNGQMLDTQALYYMTPDRNEESWSISMGVKQLNGQNISDASETGARIGREMTIVKTASKQPPVTLKPPIMGDGYISQFETLIMPRIIVQKKLQTELGFYCWQNYAGSDSGTISFRKDVLAPQGSLFTLTTNMRDDSAPQVSVYNEKGELTRSELPGNIVWEPTDLTLLKRLWKDKGLSVDR